MLETLELRTRNDRNEVKAYDVFITICLGKAERTAMDALFGDLRLSGPFCDRCPQSPALAGIGGRSDQGQRSRAVDSTVDLHVSHRIDAHGSLLFAQGTV